MKRTWPALLLAWIAGFVDALGYLALSKVFTAHMSGNSAAVGAELGLGNWHEAMVRGLAIPGFVAGVAVGTVGEALSRAGRLRVRLAPVALELALLICFVVLEQASSGARVPVGSLAYFCRVWLLAVAMGVQAATLRRAGRLRVRTTFISGMLTNMTANAVLWVMQRRGSRRALPARKAFGGQAALFGSIFVAFLAGGVCGGFGEVRWGSIALLVPAAGLAALIAMDWVRPFHGATG
ncbi:MAG TPA: YoaK family protein [Candidatus Acidoferrum sp.]|nr:YoaK family protein [Candidatus Acidoferrum sp.]